MPNKRSEIKPLEPKRSMEKIEKFKSDKKFDLVMIPFGSFSLLPDELVKDSLSNIRTALNEGGKILLTVMTNKSPVEEISDWIETNKQYVDNDEIVEYKKIIL